HAHLRWIQPDPAQHHRRAGPRHAEGEEMIPSYGSDATSREIAAGLRDFLAERCTLEHVRNQWAQGEFDREMWKELAALGLGGALVSAADGGLELRSEEIVFALEEFGYSGASLPL